MFGKKIRLFNAFGIQIQIDTSWFIIVLLVAWTLSAGLFPQQYEDLAPWMYWAMGVSAALGLFACVVLHELGHSLVARHYGTNVQEITLFMFGGVAHLPQDPDSPKAEFWMAAAGPMVSIVLGGVSMGVSFIDMPVPVSAVFWYLGIINFALAAFNLLPGFPLDGGRLLRAALWQWKNDLVLATRIATRIGSGIAYAMWAFALLALLGGNLLGTLWWFILGMFLRGAAVMAYKQVVWKEMLRGVPVRAVMNPHTHAVPPGMPVREFADDYLYRSEINAFPVVDDNRITGCIRESDVRKLPQSQWPDRTVGSLSVPCPDDRILDSGDKALDILKRLQNNPAGAQPFYVLEDGQLAGILTPNDLLRYLQRRSRFEGV